MTVQPNGTDAKDIALHFVDMTTGRATPTIMKKTIIQAKVLLSNGYTKDEIIKTIDHIISKGIEMYSLGYVNASINDILREIQKIESSKKVEEQKIKLEETIKSEGKEVIDDGE